MLRLETQRYEVVLTVHDEIICRRRKGEGSLEEFKHLLEQPPDWAKAMGMPLGAKVWRRERWAENVNIPVEHVPGGVITPDMLAKPQRIKIPDHLRQLSPPRPTSRARAKRPSQDETDSAARLAQRRSTAPSGTAAGTIVVPLAEVAPVAAFVSPAPRNMSSGKALNILGPAPTSLPAEGAKENDLSNLRKDDVPPVPGPDDKTAFMKGNGRTVQAPDEPPPSPSSDKPMMPNRAEAARYLTLLDPAATRFTYQTFDDDKNRKNPMLAKILHGTLDECFAEMTRLNDLGAGIFVTINETDFKGRSTGNIVKVRALFGDFDNGVPLPQDGPRRTSRRMADAPP
jgi:hypothetical protein